MGLFYYGSLILFGIGIGLLVMGVIFLIIRQETKKALYSLLIGLILVIAGILLPNLRPSAEGVRLIEVESKEILHGNEGFKCQIIDEYAQITLEYQSDNKEDAERICALYEQGKQYEISYKYLNGIYFIHDEF